MFDGDQLHQIFVERVQNDIRRSWYSKLSRIARIGWTATLRELPNLPGRSENETYLTNGCRLIVGHHIIGYCIELG
jgi:hypothetical protein